MKRLSISLLVLMLGTAVLAGCSKGSDTHLKTKSETQSQWGLNVYENGTESASENESASEDEKESASETAKAEESVKKLENDVLLLEVEDVRVKSVSGVNVRSGPGTDYDKIGSLSASGEAVMTGICSNEWIRIDLNGDTGYVLMEYLESADPEVSLSDLFDRVQSLKADGSGDTGSDESSAQESGEQGDGSDESSSDESGESSAVQSSDSEQKPAAGGDGETAWAVTDVNVRKGPKSSYEVLGQLKQGESITVLDSSDAWWWKVEFGGQEAYISVQYLTTEKPEE